MALEDYSYFFIVCEGTNEEWAFNYIQESGRLNIHHYNTDFIRAHTRNAKRELLQHITELSYDGRVAILHIRDRQDEKWDITATMKKIISARGIDIIPVVTFPEIEYLLIISNDEAARGWRKVKSKDKQVNPSGFCKSFFGCNIKNGESFIRLFNGFGAFYSACKQYKQKYCKQEALCLVDLITEIDQERPPLSVI